ncbi:hypothetical protein CORMATOL_01235 [Corynebacterium matruchotii ATCC 33806]|uniref:Uncharacterized protein n=1 Tax=Corynebacterium matruchotii ATCC 33806 TaxID=566549 RepID=C0E2M9_9CORY|nr:hypothetical protein CORMATOL_01235 [Corynebacterium matruchotii ATCC 33806]
MGSPWGFRRWGQAGPARGPAVVALGLSPRCRRTDSPHFIAWHGGEGSGFGGGLSEIPDILGLVFA